MRKSGWLMITKQEALMGDKNPKNKIKKGKTAKKK